MLDEGIDRDWPISDIFRLASRRYNLFANAQPSGFYGILKTDGGVERGKLEGTLEPGDTIVGEWSNFDAQGTTFVFTVTGVP